MYVKKNTSFWVKIEKDGMLKFNIERGLSRNVNNKFTKMYWRRARIVNFVIKNNVKYQKLYFFTKEENPGARNLENFGVYLTEKQTSKKLARI